MVYNLLFYQYARKDERVLHILDPMRSYTGNYEKEICSAFNLKAPHIPGWDHSRTAATLQHDCQKDSSSCGIYIMEVFMHLH